MPVVPPYPRPDSSWLAEQYGAGRTQADLAAELGVSPGTVRAWLLAAGIQLRPMGRPSRIRPDELERLVAAGSTIREMATHFGLSRSAVLDALRRHGLRSANAYRPLDEDTVRAIRAAYGEGLSYVQVAERFAITPTRVATLASQGRLTPRPRWVVTAPVEKILARHDAGERASRIAEELGVNERTVRFWVTKHRRSLPPALHPEALREAVRAGAEVRDIAAQAGVSLTLCYKAIAAAHASSLLPRRPIDPGELLRGLAAGRSIVELAADWNTTPNRIRRVRRRLV